MNLQSMAEGAAKLLKERKETISVAESSAGGIISAGLLSVP
ncbi:MAG: damage-inducible protein, partial [Gammaproteobacteria bacterium]|nr:damage-inducible protein [Gammaproteobacteria bacterium]